MTAFAVEVALLLSLVFLIALAFGYRLGRRHRPPDPAPAEAVPPAVTAGPPSSAGATASGREPEPEPPIVEPSPPPQQDLFVRLGITDMNAVPPLDEDEDEALPPRATPSPARAATRARRRTPESLPGVRPPALEAPEGEAGDDLKLLRGIGPQNEQRLNEIGIFHFRQIAAWTPDEAAWVGSYLAFPGRIEREDWVGQAKSILDGGSPPPRRRR